MKIWNLTPHPIAYEHHGDRRSFLPAGTLRLSRVERREEAVAGLETVHVQYGTIDVLPEGIQPGDVILVSTIVADALARSPQRVSGITVLVPDTGPSCRRDADGNILSVCQFVRRLG